MQLYAGMDIGTAKLPADERRGVPHHLLDIWPVTRAANVAEYQELARAEIDRLRAAAARPSWSAAPACTCAAPWTSSSSPAPTPTVRAPPGGRARRSPARSRCTSGWPRPTPRPGGPSCPATAAASCARWRSSRSPAARFTATLPEHTDHYPGTVHLGLDIGRPALDERIALRVDRMWDAGFVQEVRALEPAGLRDGLTASRALGYAQVLRFLAGECTEAEAKEETVRATQRFARRQDSWFRRDPRVTWLRFDTPGLTAAALDRIGA